MDNKTVFTKRLNKTMHDKNLKQIDIINQSHYIENNFNTTLKSNDLSQYCNGTIMPRDNKLKLLAASLGVDKDWLVGNDLIKTDNRFQIQIHSDNMKMKITGPNYPNYYLYRPKNSNDDDFIKLLESYANATSEQQYAILSYAKYVTKDNEISNSIETIDEADEENKTTD